MDISPSPTPLTVADVFTPEFLRTVRDRVLLVPRLLEAGNCRARLHVASNGKGDRYHVLRLTPVVPTGKNAEELFHYIGKLNEYELPRIKFLLAEHERERIPTGTQRLRQLQPAFELAAIIWAMGKAVARYTAALAGFNMRDYRLHRRRSGVPSPHLLPPALMDISDPSLSARDRAALEQLHDICRLGPSDPLMAALRAFGVLQFQAIMTSKDLLDVLGHAYVERSTSLRLYGTCRRTTKAEKRAIVKRKKVERILDAIKECQAALEAEMRRKGVWHEDW